MSRLLGLARDLVARQVYATNQPTEHLLEEIGVVRYQAAQERTRYSKALQVGASTGTWIDELDRSPLTWHVFTMDTLGRVDAAVRMVIHPDEGMSETDQRTFLPPDLQASLQRHLGKVRTAEIGRLVARRDVAGGGRAMVPLARRLLGLCADERIRIVFGICRTGLLRHYMQMGYRPYTTRLPDLSDGARLVLVADPWELSRYRGGGVFLRAWVLYHRLRHRSLRPLDLGFEGDLALVEDHTLAVERVGAVREYSPAARRLLRGLSQDELHALREWEQIIRFNRDQRFISQGLPERAMYLILRGVVDIVVDGEWVTHRSDGDVVGELAVLRDDHQRTADVVARSDEVEALVLSWSDLRFPRRGRERITRKLLYNLSAVIAEKLAETTTENVALKEERARLQQELVRLTSTNARK